MHILSEQTTTYSAINKLHKTMHSINAPLNASRETMTEVQSRNRAFVERRLCYSSGDADQEVASRQNPKAKAKLVLPTELPSNFLSTSAALASAPKPH
jgi:hypothetical protein